MNIAFAGATGAVGRYLFRIFEKSEKEEQVHVFTRRAIGSASPHIHEHQIDFDRLEEVEVKSNIDVAISCLGTTQKKSGKEGFYKVDHDYVVALGKWALNRGAKQYIVITSVGPNPSSWYSFYLKTKGETERDVSNLGYESVVFVRPPLLEGPRDENRPTEVMGSRIFSVVKPLFVGPLKYSLPVHTSQVANAIYDSIYNRMEGKTIVGPKEIHQFDSFHD